MKLFNTFATALLLAVITIMATSCDNSRKKLESIASDENNVYPCHVGQLIIDEAEVTDTSYNYLATLTSGYFDLSNPSDRELLQTMLFSYITLNKKPKYELGKGDDLLPTNVQGTGRGLDLTEVVGKRPVIFIIRDENGKEIDQFSYDFSEKDALLASFFGMDYDLFAITTGDVMPRKSKSGDGAAVIFSSHFYNMDSSRDVASLRGAILEQLAREEKLLNAVRNIPADGQSRTLTINAFDINALQADSLAPAAQTYTVTPADIIATARYLNL